MIRRILPAALAMMLLCTGASAQAAFVNSGGDPQGGLHMRSEPGTQAASLGRFFSGTQVEIVADAGGGWSQVCIAGSSSARGYMKTSYLCGDMNGVADARQEKQVASPYGTPVVVLRDRPANSYDALTMLAVGEKVRVIGVAGEFCYVLCGDGTVGCLAGEEIR